MKTILAVDDNAFILQMISLYFAECVPDCTVLTAGNGKQALEIIQSVPVDFIMTDLDMPVMNGYQLIEVIKRKMPSMPIFAMTGYRSTEVAERVRMLGAAVCLQKPFNFEDVLQKISSVMEEARSKPALTMPPLQPIAS